MHARILLVEDSPTQRMVAQMILESAGFEVTVVEDAESVVLDANHPFDLALVDHVLPGASGLELCRRLVRDGGPPVVAMTGAATAGAVPSYLDAGAVSWLPKPLDPATTGARVTAILAAEATRRDVDPPGPTRAHLVELVGTCIHAIADAEHGASGGGDA